MKKKIIIIGVLILSNAFAFTQNHFYSTDDSEYEFYDDITRSVINNAVANQTISISGSNKKAKQLNVTQNNKEIVTGYNLFQFFPDQVQEKSDNLPDRHGKITGDSYEIEELTQSMIQKQIEKHEAGVNNGGILPKDNASSRSNSKEHNGRKVKKYGSKLEPKVAF